MLLYGKNPAHSEPPSAVERAAVPAGADGAEAVRDTIEQVLREWGRTGLIATAALCASELVAAVAEADCGEVVLVMADHGGSVEVGLDFVGTGSPVRVLGECADTPAAAHLTVVDRAASLWGVVPLGGGERVWFELDG